MANEIIADTYAIFGIIRTKKRGGRRNFGEKKKMKKFQKK